MKILVCVKAVPLTESNFQINETGDFYEESSLKYQVNEYDLYAMEEAVRTKELLEEVEITGVMVGPPPRMEQLRKALALGADQGVLIDDSARPARDAFSVASLICSFSRDRQFDMVFCGVMSEDLMQAQTGPMLAEMLGFSCATTVVACKLNKTEDKDVSSLYCERELEGGITEKVELELPAVITVQSGINTPRYASLSNVLRVKEMEIPVLNAEDLYSGGPGGSIVAVFPEITGQCEFLEGDSETVALELIEKIRARTQVI